ncbi:MAG: glycosyltransferase family 39 protein [Candidatus Dormibacteraceae bacterium]
MILAVGVLAAAARFYRLTGRSLWLDETVTAQSAHLNSAGDVIAQSLVYVNQAPLFYLITWLLRPWGDGEFILRLPAAIAGTLAVLAMYLIGNRILGVRGGLVAALLMAVMPYAVWYSQEARNYALFMLITSLQIYFAFNAVTRSRRLDWLGLALFTALNLYTHYLAFAATAGVVVYVALFLGQEILRGTSGRTKAVAATIVTVAAIVGALVARRTVLRAIFLAAEDVLTKARLHPAYALAAGLATVVALGAFGLYLRKRSRRAKVAVAACLLIAIAAAVVVVRLTEGSSQVATQLQVVAIYLALGLALGVVVALLAQDLLQRRPELARKLEWATIATVLVAILYAPWLPYLRLAISRPDVTIGQLHPGHNAGFQDILSFLDRLGISGFLLALFVVGLVAIVVGLFRGRAAASALVLCTIFIPAMVLVLTAGPAIVDLDSRYLAFLFPGAILVIAAGVEAAATLAAEGIRRLRPSPWPNARLAAAVPTLVLVALLLLQVLPALAASYQLPKQDYRSAAQHIVSSRPAPVLLSLGNYSDWSLITFGYYLNELHSPVTVVEGQLMNSNVASTLAASTGTVWGVVIFPSAQQLQLLRSPGAARVDFVDATQQVYLVHTTDQSLSPAQQARELLSWESPVEPRLRAVVKLMDYVNGQAQLGPDLLADATAGSGGNGWRLQPGVATAGGALSMGLGAQSPELNATTTVRVQSGVDYIVSLECLNSGLSGWQRVYATATDQAGHEVSTLPGSGGFVCPTAATWTSGAFAFQAPATTTMVTLVLRAHGTGIAEFRNVHMNSFAVST